MGEQRDLDAAVDKFATAMKKRLGTKRKQGWYGWEDPELYDVENRLLRNAAQGITGKDKKSLVDVANLAMFLWRI